MLNKLDWLKRERERGKKGKSSSRFIMDNLFLLVVIEGLLCMTIVEKNPLPFFCRKQTVANEKTIDDAKT